MPRAQAGWIVLETYNLSYDLFAKLLKILNKSNIEWLGVLKAPGSIDVLIADRLFTVALSPFDLIIKDHEVLKEIRELPWINKYIINKDTWLDYIRLNPLFLSEIFDNIEKHGYYSSERFEIRLEEKPVPCSDILVINYSEIIPPGIFGYSTSQVPYNVLGEFWKKKMRIIAICIHENEVVPVVYVITDKKPVLFINKTCLQKIGNPIHFFIIDFISMFEVNEEVN